MNVLVCAACGRRLSEPLRLPPELPERPESDGSENPDGSRHIPSTPPTPGPDGARTGPGRLMSAGPRDNEVCPGCGAEVATRFAERHGPYGTHCLPEAVSVAAV
ncbi:hypothetical protein [Streptomyces guryensis]|uniref:Uncharacterized protein n=1 Tax=Streptomyces guryensis TaxID=2886947 RepID=A0A9Q3ZBS2_9ACTN|nr:hypothetical protein [Streptomyces guryensis]MCD9876645.1 hypothetical protein [Streptomyces guryensis]